MRKTYPPIEPVADEFLEPTPGAPVYRALPAPHVRAVRFIWFLVGLVDVMVGLRFLLKLLGASVASPFVNLLYGLTAPLVNPFRNIFPVTGQGPFIFEPSSLVALVIYPLIGLGAVALIRVLGERRAVARWP